MESLPLLDFAVIFIYLAAVVGMGCWFARRSGTTEEFMLAGRSLSGWLVGLSVFGTYVSSISFLANPGKSYQANWNPFVFGLSLPLGAWIATRWFVPFYRRLGTVSAYEHLEARFGSWARTYALICYLLTQIVRMGAIMYLVALALAPLTGWDVRWIIVATGVLVTIYTLLGGIEAVIWTDAVQSVVLTIGILVSCGVILTGMPEGPGQLFEIAADYDKFSLGSFAFSFAESTFWVVLLYGLFINLNNFGIDQTYVQRYLTARSERDASRSVWLGAMLFLPVSGLLFFVGTGLFAFYTAQPDLLPEGIKPDGVFPHFIVNELPAGLTGLLIAAVFAAAMSSVDSSLNCSATLILEDIFKRYLTPGLDERGSMRVLHISTGVLGVLGTTIALALVNVESVLDVWWKLAGILSGGMLGLFLLGMTSRRAGRGAAAAATVVGVALIIWLTWLTWFEANPLHSYMTIVVGTTTILVVGWLLAGLGSPKEPQR